MLEVGGYVALALVLVQAVLAFFFVRGKTTKTAFVMASLPLLFFIVFFWMDNRITEITIPSIGTIKTAATLATQYVEDIKTIKTEAEHQKQIMTEQLQQITQQLEQAQKLTHALEQKQEYWEVARLNTLGVHFVGGDLVEHSGLNDIIGPYVRVGGNGKVEWDCSQSAVDAYSAAIKYDSKFPFPYFYRASCYSLTNENDWHHDIDTARSILIVTTQIPGHHVNHDEILKMIEKGNLGNRTR